jgi:hypothetical protein
MLNEKVFRLYMDGRNGQPHGFRGDFGQIDANGRIYSGWSHNVIMDYDERKSRLIGINAKCKPMMADHLNVKLK